MSLNDFMKVTTEHLKFEIFIFSDSSNFFMLQISTSRLAYPDSKVAWVSFFHKGF